MKVVHWNVSTATPHMSGMKRYEDELFQNLKALGADLELARVRRMANPIIGNVPVSWLLRYNCEGADIVHATFQTLAPAAYFRRPRKFIVTVLDSTPLLYPSTVSRDLSTRIQWMLTPKALKRADRIITISEFTKKELVRLSGIDQSLVDAVHLAVDRSQYYPRDREECKRRFGFNTEEKHVLVVASNDENKRMDLTQKVFAEVRRRRKDIKLIKAGYAEVLTGEGIINVGWVPEADMPLLYNSADVFLNTSEYEGFCLPVLEAMSCGVPVVVSNKASIPEVVGPYGNMVDLDAEDAVTRFGDMILECIDRGADEEALKQSENFSWKETAEKTLRVYKGLYE